MLFNKQMHICNEITHIAGPWLAMFFMEELKFSQKVCITDTVVAVIVKIGFPEVMNQMAIKFRNYSEVIDSFRTSPLVYAIEG
ncbi:hypothetical protein BMS3Abin08_01051 [bacterium BMS3Abin08]|nr:hypothetical protein BMS3Abin08_01051 [bacterium BMS3Abin08]